MIQLSFEQWCYNNLTKEEANIILQRWDYELNNCSPSDISYGTNKQKYYFKCARGIHKSELKCINNFTRTYSKNNNTNILDCNQCNSFEQWCLDNISLDIAFKILSRWDYELNKCKPSEISHASHGFNNKGYWFKCPRGLHESELHNIKSFTSNNTSLNCRKCNSFAQWGIDNLGNDFLEKYWSDKNIINPWEIDKSSRIEVLINCLEKNYHNNYSIKCFNFILGNRCPCCAGKTVHPLDSLGTTLKDRNLLYIWSDKNKKSPYEYTPNSGNYVWFKCVNNKHKDYYKRIMDAYRIDFHCHMCTQKQTESYIQQKVRLYIETLGYPIFHENNCTLRPINLIKPPIGTKNKNRKGGRLRYDNEIIIEGKHLFIETMGSQHERIEQFHILSAKTNGTTIQQEFEYELAKDKFKEDYIYQQGDNYYYLPVWYYDFDNKNTYKDIIDNKINNIICA